MLKKDKKHTEKDIETLRLKDEFFNQRQRETLAQKAPAMAR